MQALTRAGIGDTCTIKWMLVNREIRDFMESLSISEGSEIQIIQKTSGGMVISANSRRLAIGEEIADRIKF